MQAQPEQTPVSDWPTDPGVAGETPPLAQGMSITLHSTHRHTYAGATCTDEARQGRNVEKNMNDFESINEPENGEYVPASPLLTLIKKFGEATNDELYDAEFRGGKWMIEAVETQESFENFIDSSKMWAERSATMNSGEIAGFKYISWNKVQPKKGAPRRQVSVVDFGAIRIVLDCDLSNFS
jgi:hypothetical protein